VSLTQELSHASTAGAEKVHEFMLAAVQVTPERPAVIETTVNGELHTLSYRELDNRVRRYAASLDALGLDIGDRVVVESDNSGPAIAMFLACSTLGLTFVPVSPETPAQRLLSVADTAGAALHLQAAEGRREGVPEPVGLGRFGPDAVTVERAPVPRTRHRREVVSTDTAYMIFTSGTTGRPKGVVMSHRGVLAFYRGMLRHAIVTHEDRVATTSPLQFDFSLLDIGLALGSGATIVPVPRDLLRWPRRFLGFLRDTRATQVDGVPSIWRPVLRHEPEALAQLTHIRGIMFSGESFPLPELRQLRSLLPHLRITNCFGSTESMAASLTDVPNPIPEDLAKLSIGFAHAGAELLLLDEYGAPVERSGVIGEIYLRSPALFNGYWGDPVATQGALVPDPLNPRSGQLLFRSRDLAYRGPGGELYFVGRADTLVKVRGNRVEVGEVERRLREFPGIAAAAAALLERPGKEPGLGAFVVPAPGVSTVDEADVSAFCLEALPDYMVPQELHVVAELPTTPNGKLDRAALVASVAG
jgi:amino acid adenylation domain-containing protein